MAENSSRFVLLCQQVLVFGTVAAVVAPAANLLSLDIVEPAGLPQLSRVQLVEQNKNSTVSGTAFKRPIEDFFFTDPISRSSPTMARCSAAKAQKIAKTNFMAPGEPEAQVAYGV